MNEITVDNTSQLLPLLSRPADLLVALFRADMGGRIGESTVASKKMHTFTPARPEEVTITRNNDAGQVFYHRPTAGEVCHLDVFHQCGCVDHRKVAAAVKKAVEQYNFHYSLWRMTAVPGGAVGVRSDLIDIQTASGGGRLTGSLNYGRKLSLRRAHENHVHIAAMLPDDHLACLFYIVMAVEEVVVDHKLELRRNERLVHSEGQGAQADLSAYSDHSDSFLKDNTVKNRLQAEAREHQYAADIDEVADIFETAQDMKAFLTKVEQHFAVKQTLFHRRPVLDQETLERLGGLGLVAADRQDIALTEYGKGFKAYLDSHQHEVEAQMRKAFRLMAPAVRQPGRGKLACQTAQGSSGRQRPAVAEFSHHLQDLAVAETVNAAARRAIAENRCELVIDYTDIRQFVRQTKHSAAVCLVVDASASMIGPRLKAAKHLVRHLLLATPDRISLIVFQQEQAKVELPFTRDYRQAEECLRKITAFGSTPLALGLRTCCRYLQEAGRRSPSIILITDGIPTVGDQSRDPMADSLAAAGEIKSRGYGFTCFGLKPYRQYLTQLAQAAGGTVCVLDELEKSKLVECAGRQQAALNGQ
ncbi:MAG: VWA domain-containing protein [Negativicutes bacterium]|nr:VWA domain-containing protein [Negativicutes bacterium]